jgi:hypothetical protein
MESKYKRSQIDQTLRLSETLITDKETRLKPSINQILLRYNNLKSPTHKYIQNQGSNNGKN